MKPKILEGLGRELRDLILQILRDYSEALLLAVVMAVILRLFVVGSYKVSNTSMEPSLKLGDFVLGYKLPFGFNIPFSQVKVGRSYPRRNDIIVFMCPGMDGKMCLKRVVGLPGDRIEIQKKRLIINGKRSYYRRVPERPSEMLADQATVVALLDTTPFGRHTVLISDRGPENFGPYIVPPGAAFVLADNRDYAEDSRHWGAIPLNRIESRAQLIWFSVEWSRKPNGFYDADVRWSRILGFIH